jgi:hypothetical protein
MELLALQAMAPKFDSPFESQGKALQLRQMMAADQQNQYQQQQQRQAQQDDQSYRAALQANPGGGAGLLSALAGSGNYKGHAAAVKADQDARKGNADIDKTKADTAKSAYDTAEKQFEYAGQLAGGWANNPGVTRQQIATELNAAAQIGIITPEIAQAKLAEIQTMPEDPRALQGWANKTLMQVMKAKDQFALTTVDANTAANNATSTANSKRSAASSKYSADSSANSARQRLAFDKSQMEGTGPDASEAMIDAIGQGKMSPPTGYALRNPKVLAMMERVAQKYPDYDATEYAGKTRAMRDFTTGRQGDSIRSFAVASDHLKQLDGLVDALNNKDIPLINKYGNLIAQNTGSAAPTNFDAAKGIVAKEVLKSIVAGGGGVEERQELSHLLSNAKTGPQLKGVIKTYLHLMEAQKDGLERQYEVSTGRKDAKTRFDYSKKAGAGAPAPGGVVDFSTLKD